MGKITRFLLLIILIGSKQLAAQDSTFVLTSAMFDKDGYLELPKTIHWRFKEGNDSVWANPNFDHSQWRKLDSLEIENIRGGENGIFEGWFVLTIKLDSSFSMMPLYLEWDSYSPATVYVNGKRVCSFGDTNYKSGDYKTVYRGALQHNISLPINQDLFIAIYLVDVRESLYRIASKMVNEVPIIKQNHLWLVNHETFQTIQRRQSDGNLTRTILLSICAVLMILFWLIALLNQSKDHIIRAAINVSFLFTGFFFSSLTGEINYGSNLIVVILFAMVSSFLLFPISFIYLIASALGIKVQKPVKIFLAIIFITPWLVGPLFKNSQFIFAFLIPASLIGVIVYLLIRNRHRIKGAIRIIVAGPMLLLGALVIQILSSILFDYNLFGKYVFLVWLIFPMTLLVYVAFWLKEMMSSIEDNAMALVQASNEKKEILENQNIVLEQQVLERTEKLNTSLENLKATQSQLIQSEKMASLGELTAGIAHEIQNPLNFVNNFSEVNEELLTEMKDELDKGNISDAKVIANDAIENQQKILHHGKRADAIVKGMLQHSRTGSGKKELTDINALCDEYLRLSYHGLRAKEKSFNAKFETDFDASLPKGNLVPQDIGRVVLNLINNAFYAVNEKAKSQTIEYEPTVIVSTKKVSGKIEIGVKDNGNGIPDSIKEKIFQPFFTTKPTGQGTGLGLSLSYDIIKAHGGEINLESSENMGTTLTVKFPIIT